MHWHACARPCVCYDRGQGKVGHVDAERMGALCCTPLTGSICLLIRGKEKPKINTLGGRYWESFHRWKQPIKRGGKCVSPQTGICRLVGRCFLLSATQLTHLRWFPITADVLLHVYMFTLCLANCHILSQGASLRLKLLCVSCGLKLSLSVIYPDGIEGRHLDALIISNNTPQQYQWACDIILSSRNELELCSQQDGMDKNRTKDQQKKSKPQECL